VVDDPTPPLEQPSGRHPLVLLTGRGSASQWHTETRTGKSPTLRALAPDGLWVDIHPDDAAHRAIEPGDQVVVESPRGAVRARAQVTPTVAAGQVFLPMHHPQVNALTFPSFDPHSRQPSYKYAAVEVRRPEPWDVPDA
jgi:anaerobic selenocysteine-containing dehydrogenase